MRMSMRMRGACPVQLFRCHIVIRRRCFRHPSDLDTRRLDTQAAKSICGSLSHRTTSLGNLAEDTVEEHVYSLGTFHTFPNSKLSNKPSCLHCGFRVVMATGM